MEERRNGLVPGTGKHICQKLALGATNSTPTKVLPSRDLRIVVTLQSMELPLFSLTSEEFLPYDDRFFHREKAAFAANGVRSGLHAKLFPCFILPAHSQAHGESNPYGTAALFKAEVQ